MKPEPVLDLERARAEILSSLATIDRIVGDLEPAGIVLGEPGGTAHDE